MKKIEQKITPFLWFNTEAEAAVNYYVSMFSEKFGDTKINSITRYDEAGANASGQKVGSVMTIDFQLAGQNFVAINGGPFYSFSGAVSFVINCETQDEVDYFWEKLSEGGEAGVCGWINRDRFNLTWQVVPIILTKLLQDQDSVKSQNVMKAMLKMTKIEIKELQDAYDGK